MSLSVAPELFSVFLQHIAIATAMFDRQMHYLLASHQWLKHCGAREQEILGRAHAEIFPTLSQQWQQAVMRCFEGALEQCEADCWIRADGIAIGVKWQLHPWRDSDGGIGGLIVTADFSADACLHLMPQIAEPAHQPNITEPQHAAEALRQSEARYRAIIEDQTELICRFLPDSTLTFVNGAYCRYFGKTAQELIGSRFTPLIPEEDKDIPLKHFTFLSPDNPCVTYEHRVILPNGEIRTQQWTDRAIFNEQGQLIEFQGVGVDITQRKQAEVALRLSEKMSSLGQLVVGIAHEINNPVNFICGNVDYASTYVNDLLQLLALYRQTYPDATAEIQTLTEDIDLDFLVQDLPKLLGSMKVGALRIQDIVQSLRTFSHTDRTQRQSASIHDCLDNTLLILTHRFKADARRPPITLHKHYGDLPLVECYVGPLHQVFLNLLTNAIDAIDEAFEHRSTRQCGNADYAPQITITTTAIAHRVKIAIADNGTGIPEDKRPHLFDSFFTTKPIGKGTGLGLAISYQIIVEKHGGRLDCHSQVGQGTEFTIEIPISH
jgi:PAS domain S-box-containing protein